MSKVRQAKKPNRPRPTEKDVSKKAIIIVSFKCSCGKQVPVYFDRAALNHYDQMLKQAEKAIADGTFRNKNAAENQCIRFRLSARTRK